MEKNKKLVILIILIVVGIVVWMPKGRRKQRLTPQPAAVSLKKTVPKIAPLPRKRSEFAEWGRDPFAWPKVADRPVSDLTLSGIIWDDEGSYAIIDGAVVHSGDTIAGKTVKRIEPNKVILTDGVNDYPLELE